MDLTTAPLTEFIELLDAAEVFTSMDPAEVNLPGAWLAVDEIRPHNVAGQLRLVCSLYLISEDKDALRAVEQLAELFNKARTVFTPDGPSITQGVVLPDSSTPMPALRVPIHLITESETAP